MMNCFSMMIIAKNEAQEKTEDITKEAERAGDDEAKQRTQNEKDIVIRFHGG